MISGFAVNSNEGAWISIKCLSLALSIHQQHCPSLKPHTDKKENQIFLIYREIQSGAVAKSYMRKGFPIYEEMRKNFPIYEETVSHL
jgi:hypothetical protein